MYFSSSLVQLSSRRAFSRESGGRPVYFLLFDRPHDRLDGARRLADRAPRRVPDGGLAEDRGPDEAVHDPAPELRRPRVVRMFEQAVLENGHRSADDIKKGNFRYADLPQPYAAHPKIDLFVGGGQQPAVRVRVNPGAAASAGSSRASLNGSLTVS